MYPHHRSLSDNQLASIAPETFSGLPQLTTLYVPGTARRGFSNMASCADSFLDNNLLTSVMPGMFMNNTRLMTLCVPLAARVRFCEN